MHELLERLGRGDMRILEMCAQASREWREFLDELRGCDIGTLGARLGFFQRNFEKIFESKTLGQTMMPWTAFVTLYDTTAGWGDNQPRALELVQAFVKSNCSNEVKSEARSAAISYELDQHPDYPRM